MSTKIDQNYTVSELKSFAKDFDIKGRSKATNKKLLIKLISANNYNNTDIKKYLNNNSGRKSTGRTRKSQGRKSKTKRKSSKSISSDYPDYMPQTEEEAEDFMDLMGMVYQVIEKENDAKLKKTKITKSDVDKFVSSIDENYINSLFHKYDCGAYDHLLFENKDKKMNMSKKRKALKTYINYYLNSKNDERKELVYNAVNRYKHGKFLASSFVDTIAGDQFLQEPLIHILNSNGIPSWWK